VTHSDEPGHFIGDSLPGKLGLYVMAYYSVAFMEACTVYAPKIIAIRPSLSDYCWWRAVFQNYL